MRRRISQFVLFTTINVSSQLVRNTFSSATNCQPSSYCSPLNQRVGTTKSGSHGLQLSVFVLVFFFGGGNSTAVVVQIRPPLDTFIRPTYCIQWCRLGGPLFHWMVHGPVSGSDLGQFWFTRFTLGWHVAMLVAQIWRTCAIIPHPQSGLGVCFFNESLLQDQRLSPDSERLIWLLCTAAGAQDFWIHLQKKKRLTLSVPLRAYSLY